ncbi:MAG: bifunctional pyr operon transcriptional regulator/uracil phosphoribosyltransferase PyrR [Gammaproteobacteria bacterium]|jgi:pyrimidine operon attenuation protein/uracil phosphoribosyltransferase
MSEDLNPLLDAMAQDLRDQFGDRIRDAAMIGIQRGGVWIAQALHERLGLDTPLGELNISFYRDDFSRIGMHPRVSPSHLPFGVEDRHLILVDDVLYTGRTIRAALNEIFDFGRPASVTLAVLISRNEGRELPIEAQVVGRQLSLSSDERVELEGPDPLTFNIVTIGEPA